MGKDVYRVLFFGTGKNAERCMKLLKKNTILVGAMDNNPMKQKQLFHGVIVDAPEQKVQCNFDYVLITSMDFQKIQEQLEFLGVVKEKRIAIWQFDHSKYGEWNDFLAIEEINFWETELKLQVLQHKINNMPYEQLDRIKKKSIKFPKILGAKQAIKELVEHRKSLSRFGEGEFRIIMKQDIGFQKSDERLAKRLREILQSRENNVLIGLPDMYGVFENRTTYFVDFFRKYLDDGEREREYALFDFHKTYYDSFLTRPYIDYQDKSGAKERFEHLKKIWHKREIVIVEGNKSFLGVGNDLFQQAAGCERIECPNENAFSFYDEIMEAVKKVSKEKLILIALGPTASILAYDLAREGYQAIDIGHVDIEYEWFLRGVTEKTAIPGKYTNEVWGGNRTKDTLYISEQLILQRIGE